MPETQDFSLRACYAKDKDWSFPKDTESFASCYLQNLRNSAVHSLSTAQS